MHAWLSRLRGLPALVTPQIELPMSADTPSLDIEIDPLPWCMFSELSTLR